MVSRKSIDPEDLGSGGALAAGCVCSLLKQAISSAGDLLLFVRERVSMDEEKKGNKE